MKRSTLTVTAIGLAFLTAAAVGSAVAQQGTPGQPGMGPGMGAGWGMSAEQMAERHSEMFKVLDANGDGALSQQEFTDRANNQKLQELREQHRAERRAAHFAALDADKDGTISDEEWKAAPQMARGPGGMHGKGMGQGMGPGMMMDRDDMPRGMGPGQGGGPNR